MILTIIAIVIGVIAWFVALASGMAIEEHYAATRKTEELRFKAAFLFFLGAILCIVAFALFYLAGAA